MTKHNKKMQKQIKTNMNKHKTNDDQNRSKTVAEDIICTWRVADRVPHELISVVNDVIGTKTDR